MLKDFFKKKEDKNTIKDKILNSLMDGYVDIKAYRYDENNNKKLVYHDTGDNTVTNWMRQVILQLLSGYPLSAKGYGLGAKDDLNGKNAAVSDINYTAYNSENHTDKANKDGCCISDINYQYFHDGSEIKTVLPTLKEHPYALWPTKVLLGTGKEYVNWETLQEENEINNANWYQDIIDQYGSGEGEFAAKEQFNRLVEGKEICCNTYSATIGTQGVYDGGGSLVPTITVNDPDNTSLEESPATLANRYGVIGAVKTPYLPDGTGEDTLVDGTYVDDIINPTVSDSGRLLRSRFRGVGRPCFIYFNRVVDESSETNKYALDWSKQTSDVYLSKENKNSIGFLNRITFRVVMPCQKGNGANGMYYPYNGYTLKQIGLFNDALMGWQEGQVCSNATRMPCGMMLAVKNIASFTKTADEEINFTWTLTI